MQKIILTVTFFASFWAWPGYSHGIHIPKSQQEIEDKNKDLPLQPTPAQNSSGKEEPSNTEPNKDKQENIVTVVGKRPTTAASSSRIRSRDFLVRPRARPSDILQVTPGLLTIQHAGGGKANQYFLRGYDIDHGTDIAFYVDGVPVNMVSHGHGQGYTDLHWIVPELVRNIEVYKGPYFVEYGNFATAGAVNLVTKDLVPASSITLGGGSFNTYRGLAVGKLADSQSKIDSFVVGEVYGSDGPFENEENTKRHNLMGKMTYNISDTSRLSLLVNSYTSGWNASGQIPKRAVDA